VDSKKGCHPPAEENQHMLYHVTKLCEDFYSSSFLTGLISGYPVSSMYGVNNEKEFDAILLDVDNSDTPQ
jgi:hypothetical protein